MPLRSGAIQVKGLKPYLRASAHAEKATKLVMREKFREAGDIVKTDAASRFQAIDAKTAAGFRTVVRIRGVSVEQRLRKTTGLRPDFGALQMRKALLPSLDANMGEVERKIAAGVVELEAFYGRK